MNYHGEIISCEHDELLIIEKAELSTFDAEIFPKPRFSTDPIRDAISSNFPKCAGTKDNLEKFCRIVNNILYYNYRLFIPTEIQSDLLHDTHSTPAAGHLGFQKTLNRISKLYYWHTMRLDYY